MGKFKVVGKVERDYTDKSTGELRTARELHVLHEVRQEEGLTGQRVETMYVPPRISPQNWLGIRINGDYEAEYEIRRTSKGNSAYLVGIIAAK